MSKILLSGARIEEEFLEAVRFYESGPTFFLFNVKIRQSLFEELDNIEISFFNQQIFKKQFREISKDIVTTNYKYYDYDTSSEVIEDGIYNYQIQNFGKNTVLGYNQSSKDEQSVIRLIIDKKNIYNVGSNSYKLFIPIQMSRQLLNEESTENGNSDRLIRLRLFIKNKENKILWDSGVLLPFRPLQDLADNVQESLNLEYLTYYVQNTLESSSISYTGIDQTEEWKRQKIKISFSDSFEYGSRIGDVLPSNSTSLNSSTRFLFNLYYNDILLRNNQGTNNSIAINYLDSDFIFFSIIDNLKFITQIVEDYYSNKESFVFNLTMQLTNNDIVRDIPQYTISLKRSNPIIRSIVEEIQATYTQQTLNKFNISFDFVNLGNRKIKHIINTKDLRLPLSEISFSQMKQRESNFYYIYTNENSSNAVSLENINNLEELFNELTESDDTGNRIFYTYGNSTSFFGSNHIDYFLTYKKNEFELSKIVIGSEVLDEASDIQETNFLELTKEANRILKNNIEILFYEDNLNLNIQSPMIRQIKNIKVININQFSEISSKLGYDNVSDFLSSSIVKVILNSKFNIRKLIDYSASYFYSFIDVFNIDAFNTSNTDIDSIIDFNLLIDNDLNIKNKYSLQFLDSRIKSEKLELFNTLITQIPDFYYESNFEIYILPVHNLMSKYKNKGLEENLNVSNYFNIQEEANSVNKIFYDMFYDNSTEISFTDISKAKESYFKENTDYKLFYETIDQFILHRGKSENSSNFYSNKRKLDANSFIKIINKTSQEVEINSEPYYAYNFNNKMFDKNIKNNTFPKITNSILSNIDYVIMKKTDLLLFQYPEYLNFDLNFIKDLGLGENQRRQLENTSCDIRLNLVPYFLFDEEDAKGSISIKDSEDFFESILYDGKKCITLKPKKYKKSVIGYEEILYKGVLNNNISTDKSGNFSLSVKTNHKNFDFVKTDIYRNYHTSGVLEKARVLGYTKIYELALNVCLLIKTSSSKNREKYFSEYYQIRLLNTSDKLKNTKNIISIDNISSIIFKLQ